MLRKVGQTTSSQSALTEQSWYGWRGILRGRCCLSPSLGSSGGSGQRGAAQSQTESGQELLHHKTILTENTARPFLLTAGDVKEPFKILKSRLFPILAGVADLRLTGVLFELESFVTHKHHLAAERYRVSEPTRDPEVGGGGREGGLETGHPVTGAQGGGWSPAPVPLTAHLLSGGLRPVRVEKLPGRAAVVAEQQSVVSYVRSDISLYLRLAM